MESVWFETSNSLIHVGLKDTISSDTVLSPDLITIITWCPSNERVHLKCRKAGNSTISYAFIYVHYIVLLMLKWQKQKCLRWHKFFCISLTIPLYMWSNKGTHLLHSGKDCDDQKVQVFDSNTSLRIILCLRRTFLYITEWIWQIWSSNFCSWI